MSPTVSHSGVCRISVTDTLFKRPSSQLAKAGFYVAVALFFYSTFFPFQFDFSPESVGQAIQGARLTPYWDQSRDRIHSLPDIAANILLTIPLGFFGLLTCRSRAACRAVTWGIIGLACGLLAETIQLAIPSRTPNLTDALNNCVGAWIGAVAACLVGGPLLELAGGTLLDRKKSYLLLLAVILTASMLAPFDLSLDVSHIGRALRSINNNPWQLGMEFGDIWLVMSQYAILGALAGAMIRSGDIVPLTSRKFAIAAVVFLPLVLEGAQFLVQSHTPGLRDLLLELLGTLAGLACGMFLPHMIRPSWGAALMASALVVAGLSPYGFVAWPARSTFEWVPLVEYYNRTTASALSDAVTGLLNYALLGGLLTLSFPRVRALVMVLAVAVAAATELAQTLIPMRSPGMTDILMAAFGAYAGYIICRNIETSRY
jgi:VanZ family protein